MAITRVQSNSAASTTCSLTSTNVGDLILVFAYRTAITAPSLATGYTSIQTSTGNANSMRCGYKLSTGGETSIGTWTNATHVVVVVYSGVDQNFPIGASAAATATATTTITFPALTLQITNGTSWVAGDGGQNTATTGFNGAPSAGLTNVVNIASTGGAVACDTNGGVSSWASHTLTGLGASGSTRSVSVEIRATPGTPTTIPLVQHVVWTAETDSSTPASASTTPFGYHMWLPNPAGAGNCIVVYIIGQHGVAISSVTDDKSNTYTSGVTADESVTTPGAQAWIYYAMNVASGTQKITVTFAGSMTGAHMGVSEFYNIATTSAADGSISTTTDTGPTVSAGSFTPTTGGVDHLILNLAFAFDASGSPISPIQGMNTALTKVEAGQNFNLLDADRALGIVTQAQYMTGASAVNPTIWTTGVDTWMSLALALKIDNTKGTAPPTSGIYVDNITHFRDQQGLASPILFLPTYGNLQILCTSFPEAGIEVTINSIVDSRGVTWTKVTHANPTLYGQMWYVANVATSTGTTTPVKLTVNNSGVSNMHFVIYDVQRAATSPLDAVIGLDTSSQTAWDQNITPAATSAPATSNGLVIFVVNMGSGPMSGITAPSGAVFDSLQFDGQNDASGDFDSADGYAHYYNPNTSTISTTWTTKNSTNGGSPGGSSWGQFTVAFKGAATSTAPVGESLVVTRASWIRASHW